MHRDVEKFIACVSSVSVSSPSDMGRVPKKPYRSEQALRSPAQGLPLCAKTTTSSTYAQHMLQALKDRKGKKSRVHETKLTTYSKPNRTSCAGKVSHTWAKGYKNNPCNLRSSFTPAPRSTFRWRPFGLVARTRASLLAVDAEAGEDEGPKGDETEKPTTWWVPFGIWDDLGHTFWDLGKVFKWGWKGTMPCKNPGCLLRFVFLLYLFLPTRTSFSGGN